MAGIATDAGVTSVSEWQKKRKVVAGKDGPYWATVRVVIRATTLLLGLWLFYNHLDPRDIKTLLLYIGADVGLTTNAIWRQAAGDDPPSDTEA